MNLMPERWNESYQGPQYAIHKEGYIHHDYSPEPIEHLSRYQNPSYDRIYSNMPVANEMQTRSFPNIKTHQYSPEVYGRSLA